MLSMKFVNKVLRKVDKLYKSKSKEGELKLKFYKVATEASERNNSENMRINDSTSIFMNKRKKKNQKLKNQLLERNKLRFTLNNKSIILSHEILNKISRNSSGKQLKNMRNFGRRIEKRPNTKKNIMKIIDDNWNPYFQDYLPKI
mmetsp:Transcript_22947/g.20392  ORF Transcript_22947/g.20392 Transcript_22947/m.20392 type:complete len:145 (+) Transcript_22947:253-687(+)